MKSTKDRSRGRSADMSPAAIAKRFAILVDLENTAKALESARRLGGQRKRSSAGSRSRPKGD